MGGLVKLGSQLKQLQLKVVSSCCFLLQFISCERQLQAKVSLFIFYPGNFLFELVPAAPALSIALSGSKGPSYEATIIAYSGLSSPSFPAFFLSSFFFGGIFVKCHRHDGYVLGTFHRHDSSNSQRRDR